MKQKDIALFVLIGFVSALFSVIASNYFITPDSVKNQKAEVIEPISAEFVIPKSDDKYFNKDANNPTKLIQIGDGENPDPYKDASN